MLQYNTALKDLTLPEYGRNIQSMIDYCLTIEDREERNVCALSIIRSMGNLFPELRSAENEHKLWDHLMIMSDFQLDVDFPCEVVTREELVSTPDPVPYPAGSMRFRHYGNVLQNMIRTATEMPEGEERDQLVLLIANHMKKQMLAVNPDGVEDTRIFADLLELSEGKIRLHPDTHHLHEFQHEIITKAKKKRKRK